jgi:hypothetical protein
MLFAPTLLVGTVSGMNCNHMPELHWLLGYPLALLLMLVSSVSRHARACYELVVRMAIACWRKRQAKTTKCNPAKVAGSLS